MSPDHDDTAATGPSVPRDTSAVEGWTEVAVLVPAGWEELVATTLAEPPCTSVAFGPASLTSEPPPDGFELVRTYIPAREDSDALRAALAARLTPLATASSELADLTLHFRELPPEDYATSWRKVWRPFRVGRLCVVPPSWGGAEHALRDDDVRLDFEPKSSFGTGRHATTRTCLAVLQSRPLEGARVLDAGTGSGLLAIAAARLGAAHALGFDVDPESQPQATALAHTNGVPDRCEFRRGGFEVLRPSDTDFDVVLANLYADLIQDIAGDLAARLRPGGWFVVSGCPADKREATHAALLAAGLAVDDERVRGRWHTFAGKRRS